MFKKKRNHKQSTSHLKSRVLAAALLGCLCAAIIGIGSSPLYAATEKDTTVRLNVMNLDCSVDQVFAGNNPMYIVTPQSCTVPPVTEIIEGGLKELVLPNSSTEEGESSVELFENIALEATEEPVGVPQTSGLLVPIQISDTPASGVVTVDKEEETPSIVITTVAVSATVVASVVIVDVIVFNAQLVQASGSILRRIVQFVIGSVIK